MQQGRYDADITVKTTPKPNNRVDLLIEFVEGKAAKVFDINIIGNTVFKEDEIKQALLSRKALGIRLFPVMTVMHVRKWQQALKLCVPCT